MTIESQFFTINNSPAVILSREVLGDMRTEDGEKVLINAYPNGGVHISQAPKNQPAIEIEEHAADQFGPALKTLSFDQMIGFAREGMKQYNYAMRELAK